LSLCYLLPPAEQLGKCKNKLFPLLIHIFHTLPLLFSKLHLYAGLFLTFCTYYSFRIMYAFIRSFRKILIFRRQDIILSRQFTAFFFPSLSHHFLCFFIYFLHVILQSDKKCKLFSPCIHLTQYKFLATKVAIKHIIIIASNEDKHAHYKKDTMFFCGEINEVNIC